LPPVVAAQLPSSLPAAVDGVLESPPVPAVPEADALGLAAPAPESDPESLLQPVSTSAPARPAAKAMATPRVRRRGEVAEVADVTEAPKGDGVAGVAGTTAASYQPYSRTP
jgi:hypothetical protein